MSLPRLLYTLFLAMPEVLRLLDTLQKQAEFRATNKKVKEDLMALDKAVKERDEKSFNAIFND